MAEDIGPAVVIALEAPEFVTVTSPEPPPVPPEPAILNATAVPAPTTAPTEKPPWPPLPPID